MSYNGVPYARMQNRQSEAMAPAPVLYGRVYVALCATLPHRFYPIGKAVSLCIRCGATGATVAALPFRRRAPR